MPSEQRIKQAIYRSWHRGCKETDIILGDFARDNIHKFDDKKFSLYEKFIAENDWDLYGWVIGNIELPSEYRELITEIKNYSFININKT
jgi:antitoxin CptB